MEQVKRVEVAVGRAMSDLRGQKKKEWMQGWK